MRGFALAGMAALALAAPGAPAHAQAPPGATWTEAFIPTPDGESLHVDVLRPAGLPADAKTPVIAVISPYLAHSGGGGVTGGGSPVNDPRPSPRFNDFFTGARVFERGWTVVMIDLRGTGGSSGCLDILGPGEQSDIKTGVEWAASQPWSTGSVAMYGKSYDGNTGVAAGALRPRGLAAVIAQQVVGDRYSGSYSAGVRYVQSFAYPAAGYGTQGEGGWTIRDDPQYTLNSISSGPECQAGLAGHYVNDPTTEFWRSRDFVTMGRGSTVPMFMTLGFLDVNTNIGAKAVDYWNGLTGPKRLWIGWWDHVRGAETAGDRLAMGRAGFYDEVMRFLDQHVRGVTPAVEDVPVAVQDSDGRWRAERTWPPPDVMAMTAPLNRGSYRDDGFNLGSMDPDAGAGGAAPTSGGPYGAGRGVWTLSPPLPHVAHIAGIPAATVEVAPVAPATNLAVNVYDVAPDGRATMISRGARLVSPGEEAAQLPLYPTEWTFAPGHRIGVLVSGSNAEAYLHQPTGTDVAVGGGSITLPFLRYVRMADQPGTPAPRLESFREEAPFDVPAEVMAAPAASALVPPAQVPAPAGEPATPPAIGEHARVRPVARLTARLLRRGRVVTVTGRAGRCRPVRVVLLRARRTLARRTATPRRGIYRTRIRARGSVRRLSARVTCRAGARTLRVTARGGRVVAQIVPLSP